MRRRGLVLAAVLVVMTLAAAVAVGVLFVAQAETAAADAHARGEGAYQAARSGLAYTVKVLGEVVADRTLWYDNPDLFQNVPVCETGRDAWYFSVYAAMPDEPDAVRYGVTDEASRINLNTADEAVLLALPGMTTERAAALIDWRDRDDDPLPDGAEQAYYETLPQPYACANRNLRTVEELLLVRGFNGQVVYGEDANLSGLLDPNENDARDRFPPDDQDGHLDRGLAGLTTVWSRERNVSADGGPRADVNGPIEALQGLSQETLAFLKICRAEGVKLAHPAELVDALVEITKRHREFPDLREGQTVTYQAPLEEVPLLVDRLTATNVATLTGLVNVTTASPEVLAAALELDGFAAREIAEVGRSLDADEAATTAWLYTSGLVDAETYKRAAPRLTTRAAQFRVRVIGFGVPSGRYCVLEGVVDLMRGRPLVYVRDLTRMGLPLALNPDEVQTRR